MAVQDFENVQIKNDAGVTVYVRAGEVRRVARESLGMVLASETTQTGPFTLDIFGRTILASALNREVHLANEHLRAVYTFGGGSGWRDAVAEVSAAMDLCKQLGVEPQPWIPGDDEVVKEILRLAGPPPAAPVAPPALPMPVKGTQSTLDLDSVPSEQAALPFEVDR